MVDRLTRLLVQQIHFLGTGDPQRSGDSTLQIRIVSLFDIRRTTKYRDSS